MRYTSLDKTNAYSEIAESEALAASDRKENQFLYGQNDPPANIPATDELMTSMELKEIFINAGWTMTGGQA